MVAIIAVADFIVADPQKTPRRILFINDGVCSVNYTQVATYVSHYTSVITTGSARRTIPGCAATKTCNQTLVVQQRASESILWCLL